MARLTKGELDHLEFTAAHSGDHAAAGEQIERLAETADPGGSVSRAEAFVRAGEQWQLAGEPARAAALFRRAIADGGPTFVDARACLVGALFQLGEHRQARDLLRRIRDERPADPKSYQWVAEALYDIGDLDEALDWATAGADLCEGRSELAEDHEMLLRLRFRVRNDLGRPEDAYDARLDELLRRHDRSAHQGP